MPSTNHTMRGAGLAPAAEAAIIQQILKSDPVKYTPRHGLATAVAEFYFAPATGSDELKQYRRAARDAHDSAVRRANDLAALGWTDADLVDFTATALAVACEDDTIAPIHDEDEADAVALVLQLGVTTRSPGQRADAAGHA